MITDQLCYGCGSKEHKIKKCNQKNNLFVTNHGRNKMKEEMRGRSIHYCNRLHNFSVTIPRCYKDVYVNSFFPDKVRLWNSLPIECFPLTYDLNRRLTDILRTVKEDKWERKKHIATCDSHLIKDIKIRPHMWELKKKQTIQDKKT